MVGFKFNEAAYYYKKNAQNDVLGIYDQNGVELVRYEYDAFGNQKTFFLVEDCQDATLMRFEEYTGNEVDNPNAKLATLNPFRYRSYYYDTETNLYYLNSRYYDPELGRFINADDISVLDISRSELNGLNLYCYCLNNPVKFLDVLGMIPLSNTYYQTHLTISNDKLISEFTYGRIFGNATYSQTVIVSQSEERGIFFAYTDVGNDMTIWGAGINLYEWLGIELYVNSYCNIGFTWSITPYFQLGVSVGIDGLGLSFGINSGNINHNISINIGIGTLAVAFAVVAAPVIAPAIGITTAIIKLLQLLFS